MAIWEFEGRRPKVSEGAFVFPTADVIGDVELAEGCYVGPGARLRGDYGSMRIGRGSAVEENVVIHSRPGGLTTIGEMVTIGHGAVIHNADIDDWAVIGMGSVVADWARIGSWAVVAEGAVVNNRTRVAEGDIVAGVPARVIGHTAEEFRTEWAKWKEVYADLARRRYPAGLKRLD